MIFNSFYMRSKKILNKIVVSPMCQYSSNSDGKPQEWHYKHYGCLVCSGAGTIIIESTAINKIGRISNKDLILNKNNYKSFKKFLSFLKSINPKIIIGIQLSHSGRKGSSEIPWIKKNQPLKKNYWTTVAPSKIKRDKHWPYPKMLSLSEIQKIKNDFVNSACLAKKIGFDLVEIHMAHGYLLHQFISGISNKRTDIYGGSQKNRDKLPLEIIYEIRKKNKNIILGCKITGSDRLKKGLQVNDAILFAQNLEKLDVDYVCISSGGILPKTNLTNIENYNTDLSKIIKKKTNLKIRVSGKIKNIKNAKKLLNNKAADIIAFGRPFLKNPNFIYKNNKTIIPKQYLRAYDQ